MTMAIHWPSAAGTRPDYMDRFFRDAPIPPSAHSSTSSISTISSVSHYDPRNTTYSGRSLSPPPEENGSDTSSIRSKTSLTERKKWYKLGTILHRRTYPQSQEADRPTTKESAETTAQSNEPAPSRRPSLPRLLADFPPPQAINTYASRPLPAVPQPQPQQQPLPQPVLRTRPSLLRGRSSPLPPLAPPERVSSVRKPSSGKGHVLASAQELSCQRCYYFTARNCNGYVLGGEDGDACEGCLQSGFFGAK